MHQRLYSLGQSVSEGRASARPVCFGGGDPWLLRPGKNIFPISGPLREKMTDVRKHVPPAAS
ncbi:MAG TPA: hypothetical protein VNW28_01535 [Chthoniobacterales bacterium]|nr:hypothetical protein [Chthoniobacterales bacterium]